MPSTEVSFYASTICANFSIEFSIFICYTVDWSMIHWNEMEKEITWNTQWYLICGKKYNKVVDLIRREGRKMRETEIV